MAVILKLSATYTYSIKTEIKSVVLRFRSIILCYVIRGEAKKKLIKSYNGWSHWLFRNPWHLILRCTFEYSTGKSLNNWTGALYHQYKVVEEQRFEIISIETCLRNIHLKSLSKSIAAVVIKATFKGVLFTIYETSWDVQTTTKTIPRFCSHNLHPEV